MRIESSVTSVSWIPREAIEGVSELPWDVGVAHYDMPPPDGTHDVEALVASDAVRFANDLRAWIEVDNGRITACGHRGRGYIGATRMRLGPVRLVFPAIAYPELRNEPVVEEGSVRFVQTAGGRPGVPAPRRIRQRPYVRVTGPTVWTTLALTISADGSSEFETLGASSFPRHWLYDHTGQLAAKTALIDYRAWYAQASPERSPWGKEESPAIVTAVETALERQLSALVMGSDPPFRRLRQGETVVEQGAPGDDLFLLFDGVLLVEVDGQPVTEVGPGAILGEMARFQGGRRTATLRAVTPCRIAVVPGDRLDHDALRQLAQGRRPDGCH